MSRRELFRASGFRKSILALTASLPLALGAAAALADDNSATPPQTDTATQAPASRQLSNDGLATMLANMGYEPTVHIADDKTKYFHLKLTSDGFEYDAALAFSDDGQTLWVSSAILPDCDMSQLSRGTLAAFIAANFQTTQARFTFNPDLKEIELLAAVPNRDLTPQILRNAIAEMTDGHNVSREIVAKANPKNGQS